MSELRGQVNTDPFDTVELVNLRSSCRTMARRATDIEMLTIANFQEHDDVQWIKDMILW